MYFLYDCVYDFVINMYGIFSYIDGDKLIFLIGVYMFYFIKYFVR